MRRPIVSASVALLLTAMFTGVPGAARVEAQTPGGTRSIPASGTTSIRDLPFGAEGLQEPELRQSADPDEAAVAAVAAQGQAGEFNRLRPEFQGHGPFPKNPLDAPVVASSAVAGSDAAVSILGLNHRDQRLANGGNQFSLEPPDQALCAGNGFVVEATNSVLRVFDRNGTALTGVQDLNTFLGYPPAIIRTVSPPVIGPQVIDPICLYDPDIQRFVVADTTLGSNPDGSFTGKNTIDLAVSNTGDPTGSWTIYRVPAQNDGTDGTPDHDCRLDDGVTHGPCFQDYPHIGSDRFGVYITTNEYDLFGSGFTAAQIFAFSKNELAAGGTVRMTLVENLMVEGIPGFTVWPAQSPMGQASGERHGTEYFLSTIAGDGSETGNPTGTARKVGAWGLTNTSSLNSATPALGITSQLVRSETYVFPPGSDQRAGDFPLGQCVNDTSIVFPFGTGCWNLFFLPEDEPAHDEVISAPDSLDTRMQQTWFVNGRLWGASGTAVNVGGEMKAGIAWFQINPKINGAGHISARVRLQGYIALANNNLSMPAIAMTPANKGVIAFSILGEDMFPTAAYARIDGNGNVGPIQVAAPGVGVDDGFTSYKAFVGDPPRTRWGDYGAAVTDGSDIWIASEYIAQTCTLDQYLTGAVGSCGGTRTALANWATRLTKIGT
ncbi:MAG TPA: hypothetical protein VGJ86_19800 [Acidimicrobiales bacterium]|jgi:hypothetical protein